MKFEVTYQKNKEYKKVIKADNKRDAEIKFNRWADILNNMENFDIIEIQEVKE